MQIYRVNSQLYSAYFEVKEALQPVKALSYVLLEIQSHAICN